jgi:hypothetical protein
VQRMPQERLDFASPGTVHSYNDNILLRVGSPTLVTTLAPHKQALSREWASPLCLG